MAPHSGDDVPPNSRLFVTCLKGTTEDELRDLFSPFGTIEDLWFIPTTNKSDPNTVISYVKFSKSSEALRAIEVLNEKTDEREGGDQEPKKCVLKVILAASRRDGNVYRGKDGTEHLDRLHLTVRSTDTEESVTQEFSQYGKVVDVMIIRGTFAYISYSTPYEAAVALETCAEHKSRFRPCIAEPRPPRGAKRERETSSWGPAPHRACRYDNDDYRPYPNGIGSISRDRAPPPPPPPHLAPPPPQSSMRPPYHEGVLDLSSSLINNPTRCTGLFLKINYPLTRDALFKLCNLIPSLDTVELHQEAATLQKTIAYVHYESATSAAWAWQKFQDFEYPPGFVLRVRYSDAGFPKDWQMEFNLKTGFTFPASGDPMAVPGPAPGAVGGSPANYGYPGVGPAPDGPYAHPAGYPSGRNHHSSITLGPPKPGLPRTTAYTDRCFFSTTNKLSMQLLEEVFSSFGDFIDVYYLSNRNCGYVLYGSEIAASTAAETLNGEKLYGELFKVVKADPDPSRYTPQE